MDALKNKCREKRWRDFLRHRTIRSGMRPRGASAAPLLPVFANARRGECPISEGMRHTTTLSAALLSAWLALLGSASCAHNNKDQNAAIQKLPEAQADALSASHSNFENSEDPPFTADTRFAAGQLAESQNQQANAIAQYREALKIDPKHQPSIYRLAVLYTQARQYPQAIETWKQYVRATNGSATAWSNLAFCYELADQPQEAEQAYKTGIDPNDQPCRVNYGLMLARNNHPAQAIEQLSAVLKPAEVHYNLASVYEQIGQKESARSEYQKALELDPKMWEAQTRLSKLD
jgi:tetratricopeptide (TPR) repeat protein